MSDVEAQLNIAIADVQKAIDGLPHNGVLELNNDAMFAVTFPIQRAALRLSHTSDIVTARWLAAAERAAYGIAPADRLWGAPLPTPR
ncbi:hypothetical protein [Gemmata sp.]|uniref:hypothetical protein n=1 Tax=Gemmata sp. TaxID=1914242 RepID=UPI003F6FD103